jgi:hypothetical protein
MQRKARMPFQSKILIPVASLCLLGVLLCSCHILKTMSRDQNALPHTPVVVHYRDCIWVIDSEADVLTHGPFCLSGFWEKVVIGDVEIAASGHLYISMPLRMDPDLRWGDTVLEFDPTKSKKIGRIEVLTNPDKMVVASNGLLYVTTSSDKITVIDLQTNAIVDQIKLDLPCEPDTLILGPKGTLHLSACWLLAEVDTATNSVSTSPTQFRPDIRDMAMDLNGYLYLLLYDEVRILDPVDWQTIASIGHNSDLSQCNGLRIATGAERAFVTCHDTEAIVVYDVASNATTSIPLPDWYIEIAAVSKGKLYLLQKDTENVLVLDTRSGEILTEIPLPKGR